MSFRCDLCGDPISDYQNAECIGTREQDGDPQIATFQLPIRGEAVDFELAIVVRSPGLDDMLHAHARCLFDQIAKAIDDCKPENVRALCTGDTER